MGWRFVPLRSYDCVLSGIHSPLRSYDCVLSGIHSRK